MTEEKKERNRLRNRKGQHAYRKRHPTVSVWRGMMQRCGHYKGAPKFMLDHYAERGITVAEEWREFKTFEKWCLDQGWKPGLQVDRIDNDGPYAPWNCRLVTPSENIRNRRNTVMFGGKSLAHWYDAMGHAAGVSYTAFLLRVRARHWPICKALFEPLYK